jgi:hypothetical protein
MPQKDFYQHSTFLEMKDNEKITSRIANQAHVQQCKKKLGQQHFVQKVFKFFQKVSS